MTLTTVLRSAAVTLAIAGVVEPSWESTRRVPVPVELQIVRNGSPAEVEAAARVRRRLDAALDGRVSFTSDAEPLARVLVGAAMQPDPEATPTVPTSTVTLGDPSAPNLRIVEANDPAPVPAGWIATASATVEARGTSGTVSQIVLEHQGVELARREHAWSRSPERLEVSLPYALPVEDASRLTLRVLPADREADLGDNAVDLRSRSRARRLKVLAHEARPSWAATFVRRALERTAVFEVSTLVQLSKGLTVEAGSPPPELTAESLVAFDAVLVGAPEELTSADVDALVRFARRRGGTVVLLPDRRPSGGYLASLGGMSFDEVLIDAPVELRSPPGGGLRASELATPRGDVSGADILASTAQEKTPRPVVLSWPLGAGRVILSGALDAWRFRGAGEGEFDRFWQARIAEAAMAAPARLDLSVTPNFAAPGEEVTIRARLRPTELDESPERTRAGPIGARIVGEGGESRTLRPWPTPEAGAFEARLRAPRVGTYTVVAASGDLSADDRLTVSDDVRRPVAAEEDVVRMSRLLSSATGGVSVGEHDLTPLVNHLAGLAPGQTVHRVRPTRTAGFVAVVGILLCLEWTLRRRKGLA
jgi:hypothetical protein